MSVRKQFATRLGAAKVRLRILATERELDEIRDTTALIRLRSVGRTPSAPLSHRNVGLLLTLISQYEDADRAADEMEDVVSRVLDFLDTFCIHGDAEAVDFAGRVAFDIPVTITASKE